MQFLLLLMSMFFAVPTVHAQTEIEIIPELSMLSSRSFVESFERRSEETVPFERRGSHLILEYSSDAPFEFRVAFPIDNDDPETLTFKPIHTLRATMEPLEHARIALDLTRSPAWSASREQYLLQVVGPVGSTILIHDAQMREPTFVESLSAYVRHFFIDEPVLLSSINFLHGYRVGDRSVVGMLGLTFLGVVLVISLFRYFVFRFAFHRAVQVVPFLCLLFLLLYDARLNLDLFRVTVVDLKQWSTEGQYRMLGPVQRIAEFLRDEQESVREPLKVAVCYDGADLLEKQLKYHLYPIAVDDVENLWDEATYAVLIDTHKGVVEEGVASCGEEFQRRGRLLRTFPQNSRVVQFSNI